MTRSPLVPAPDLPYEVEEFERDTLSIKAARAYGACIRVARNGSYVTPEDAPAVAAAMLAAAGLHTYRVIDLGGPLPSVERWATGEGYTTSCRDGVTRQWYNEDVAGPRGAIADVRHALAVLEAQAAVPDHDPAEVDAVTGVFRDFFGTAGPSDEAAAVRVLDALAAVRATAGVSS